MDSFDGKLAVVTGGGTGMGRELVVQLAAEGCSVATCDVNQETMAETAALAAAVAPRGTRVSTHLCDVADESSVERFRDEVVAQHGADHVDLLFNNAGIDGFVSFVTGERRSWEKTFGVCWGGVYNCSRSFLPLLIASEDAYLVDISSINGFRAGHPGGPNTAYSTAKFAVKGFSEALIEDLRLHAPHVKIALVMPGAVATELRTNSRRILEAGDEPVLEDNAVFWRRQLAAIGVPLERAMDRDVQRMADAYRELFVTPAEEAAKIILDGVRAGRWRILVGDDAHELDRAVRRDPEGAYYPEGGSIDSIANTDAVAALLTLAGRFDPTSANDLTGEYELRLGTRRVRCRVERGQLQLTRSVADDPVAVVAGDPAAFRRVLVDGESLDTAVQQGALTVTGAEEELDKLFRAVLHAKPEAAETIAQSTRATSARLDGRSNLDSFQGKLAVVTGGGTGMGRELVVQLAAEGCSVATCDVNEETMAETAALAAAVAPRGTRVSTHLCDVADESSVERFRDGVVAQHGADHVDLLFNNAGIVAGDSFVVGDRTSWERVFGVCWGGVYNCSRVFLPLVMASESASLINTSSVQGIWVDGPGNTCTAYAAAKFAIKGFSEALIEDFRLYAPHVRAVVVLPGHISTEIGTNSARILGMPKQEADRERVRRVLMRRGLLPEGATDDDVERVMRAAGELAGELLTTSSAEAARIILDGVRAGRWRILVGDDAHRLDEAVRADPDGAYDIDAKTSLIYQGWFAPMVVLRAFFDPKPASGWSARVQLRDGEERIGIDVVNGRLTIAQGELGRADATVDIDALSFHALLVRRLSFDDVVRCGRSRLSGDRTALDRLLTAVTAGGSG